MKQYEPDAERLLLQSCLRLSTDEDFKRLMRWYRDSRQEQQDANDVLRNEDLYNGQGISQCLREILEKVESAPKALAALNSGQQPALQDTEDVPVASLEQLGAIPE